MTIVCEAQLKALNDNLKNSLAFRMSLSGKELFHSNVLAWALTEYPCLVEKLFGEYLEWKPEAYKSLISDDNRLDETRCRISREEKKFDVLIEFFPGGDKDLPPATVIFIENKFKSVPDELQLREYAEKAAQHELKDDSGVPIGNADPITNPKKPKKRKIDYIEHLILLTATKPDDAICNIDEGRKWNVLSYRVVAVKLGALMEVMPAKVQPTLGDQFIKSYVDHLTGTQPDKGDGIIDLIEGFQLALDSQKLSKIQWTDLIKFINQFGRNNKYGELRIHDLVGKAIFAVLEQECRRLIVSKLKENNSDTVLGDNGDNIHTYVTFSLMGGGAGFGLEYIVASEKPKGARKFRKLSLGVQVQGSEYRKFVDKTEDVPAYDLPQQSLFVAAKPWVANASKTLCGDTIFAFNGKSGKQYAKFTDERFRYVYFAIDKCTVAQVINLAVCDVLSLVECKQVIDNLRKAWCFKQ